MVTHHPNNQSEFPRRTYLFRAGARHRIQRNETKRNNPFFFFILLLLSALQLHGSLADDEMMVVDSFIRAFYNPWAGDRGSRFGASVAQVGDVSFGEEKYNSCFKSHRSVCDFLYAHICRKYDDNLHFTNQG